MFETILEAECFLLVTFTHVRPEGFVTQLCKRRRQPIREETPDFIMKVSFVTNGVCERSHSETDESRGCWRFMTETFLLISFIRELMFHLKVFTQYYRNVSKERTRVS